MDKGTKTIITTITWIPGIIGSILYVCGLHKVGLYLILANAVILLSLVCFCYFFAAAASQLDDGSIHCTFCVAVTFLLGVTIACIVGLVFSYKEDSKKVNYFRVDQVDLTEFDLIAATDPPALNYTLSLTVSLGPNNHEKVYYEDLRAWGYYQGHNFTSLSVLSPGEGQNQTNSPLSMGYSPTSQKINPCSSGYYNASSGKLRLVFKGQHVLVLTGDGLRRYRQEAAAGRFSIAVTVSYSGFRAAGLNEWTHHDLRAINEETAIVKVKATGYSDFIKGMVTFELKDVPLSNVINGGSVLPGGAAAAA